MWAGIDAGEPHGLRSGRAGGGGWDGSPRSVWAIIRYMGKKYLLSMPTQDGELRVPAWVLSHPAFLKWIRSGVVPEDVRVSYMRNEVWVDPMPERAFAHNQIKTLIASVLMPLVKVNKLGIYFGDGMTYTSEAEKFTVVPDGIFVSRESIDTGRVRLTGGKRGKKDTELVGIPDLVVEVVSNYSVDKDTEWLMSNYWNAGISEYWIVDGRADPIRFSIYRSGAKGFIAIRKSDGWTRSDALGWSFRFLPGENEMGHVTYDFEVR